MSACMKRQRVDSVVAAETDNNAACGAACALCSSFLKEAPAECSLLAVPREVLVQILGYLDAASLLAVAQVCKAFRTFDSTTGLRLVDTIAQTQTLQASGEDLGRWRCVRQGWGSCQLQLRGAPLHLCSFGLPCVRGTGRDDLRQP